MSNTITVSERVASLVANAHRLATVGPRLDDLRAEGFGTGYVPLMEAYEKRGQAIERFEMGIALVEVCCKAEMYSQATIWANDVHKLIAKLPKRNQEHAAIRFDAAVANIPGFVLG